MPFDDPYSHCDPKTEMDRVTVLINRHDWDWLKRMNPGHHCRPITLNILISTLIKSLKQHGLTQYDPAQYRNLVGNIRIEFGPPGGAITNSNAEIPVADDGRGTLQLAQQIPATPSQPADVSATPVASSRKRNRKSKA